MPRCSPPGWPLLQPGTGRVCGTLSPFPDLLVLGDVPRCDFQFHDAFAMYDNMDLVLAYMRASPKYSDLDIRYALLSDYFEGWGARARKAA